MSKKEDFARIERVLEWARKLDISRNPARDALYEPLRMGFNLWCTPEDYPAGGGWEAVVPHMVAGTFAKPCEYVATVTWGWDEEGERLTHLVIVTDAVALRHLDGFRHARVKNRPMDLAWAKEKTAHLFALAGVEMLPFMLEDEYREREQARREAEEAFEDAVDRTVEEAMRRLEPPQQVAPGDKVYRGYIDPEGNTVVTANNVLLKKVGLSGGDEFAWGYGGSGPATLARSILADFFGENPSRDDLYHGRAKCERLHQDFKWAFTAELDRDEPWVILGSEILTWLETPEIKEKLEAFEQEQARRRRRNG